MKQFALTGAVLCTLGVPAVAVDVTPQPPATAASAPSKYLNEAAFIADQVRQQQQEIRAAARPRLEFNYKEFTLPRLEVGKDGGARKEEARQNNRTAALVQSHSKGVVYFEDWPNQLLRFTPDWSQSGVFYVASPGDFEKRFTSKPAVTVYDGPPSQPEVLAKLRWNCSDDNTEVSFSEEETKEVTERVKNVEDTKTTGIVNVTSTNEGGFFDFYKGKTVVDFKRELVTTYTKEREITEKTTLTSAVASKAILRKYTVANFGVVLRKLTKHYRIESIAVYDTKLMFSLLDPPNISPPQFVGELGNWSDFVPDEGKRSIRMVTHVTYPYSQIEVLNLPTTYADNRECKEAQLVSSATGTIPEPKQ